MTQDTTPSPPTVAHQHLTLLQMADPADTQQVLKIPGIEKLLAHQVSPTHLLFLPEAKNTLEELLKRHHIPFTLDDQP